MKPIGIIGLGLIGSSFARALRARGVPVIGHDRDAAVAARAVAEGIVQQAFAQPNEVVDACLQLVIASPLATFAEVLAAAQPMLAAHPEVVVSDVGSVKSSIIAAALAHCPHPERFVGAHPLAGSERGGIDNGRADLFANAPVVLTPSARTSPAALAAVRALWEVVGAKPIEMTAERHDEAAALVSHLPHVAAFSLALVAGAASPPAGLHGGSFRDTTRVADSDATLWADILVTNGARLLPVIAQFRAALGSLEQAIQNADEASLRDLLQTARAGRARVMNTP